MVMITLTVTMTTGMDIVITITGIVGLAKVLNGAANVESPENIGGPASASTTVINVSIIIWLLSKLGFRFDPF